MPGTHPQLFHSVRDETVDIRAPAPAIRGTRSSSEVFRAAPMQVGARAGIGAFHALARKTPVSSSLAFLASLATLVKLTSAACSPRLNLAISRSIKWAVSSRYSLPAVELRAIVLRSQHASLLRLRLPLFPHQIYRRSIARGSLYRKIFRIGFYVNFYFINLTFEEIRDESDTGSPHRAVSNGLSHEAIDSGSFLFIIAVIPARRVCLDQVERTSTHPDLPRFGGAFFIQRNLSTKRNPRL
jgi:hypothetical protein